MMATHSDALVFIEEAISAITLEMWRGMDLESMTKVEGPETTIAEELDRIDRAIGRRGESMFGAMAEQIKECAIALYAARECLKSST